MDALLDSSAHELQFLEFFSWTLIGLSVVVFVMLRYQTAPYGRYSRFSSRWWGPNIPAKAAWVIQEFPSLFWPLFFLIMMPPESFFGIFILVLFFIHYFQRTFIFALNIRSNNPTRFIPFVLAFFFCFLNGYAQSAFLAKYFIFNKNAQHIVFFILGFIIFALGMAINIHSDWLLRNLRGPGESGHKIPQGGLFNRVSAANFFGEIVEWLGFALMAGFSLPSVAFLCFTFANIGSRGLHHHNYYLKNFDNYPKNRKAVIPFIW